MQNAVIFIFVLILFLAGSIWLQIFLSKKNNKWLGLIIPLICFMFSIMAALSLSMYTNTGTTSVTEIVDGVEVADKTTISQSEKSNMLSTPATVVPVFLISNIPTTIFLAIYFVCREKSKLRTELDKMNIQDLE